MDNRRFDALSKRLVDRRSWRSLLRQGGAAESALQEGTPPPVDGESTGHEFLFVQSFASGAWAPKPGEDGVYLLTLTGHTDQTVYFSDRPERITGVVPTERFLEALGFTPTNPPNAAVVAQTGEGEDVLVVELFNPVYQESGPDGSITLVYEARVLADFGETGLASFAGRAADGSLPASFGEASLFIDDCPDAQVNCIDNDSGDSVGHIGPVGHCYQWGHACCQPCGDGSQSHWSDQCNQQFASCNGNCVASDDAVFFYCWD